MADNYVPIKRPKPGDGEEEILQMQDDFVKNKLIPCAKVINLRPQKTNKDLLEPTVKKQSKFAQKRSYEAINKRISTSQGYGDVTNEDIDESDKSKETEGKRFDVINNYLKLESNIVLGNVVERKLDINKFKAEVDKKIDNLSAGFPAVFKYPEMLQDVKSKESLFMRTISKQNPKISSNHEKDTIPNSNSSHIISGSLAQEIHKDNVEKLKEMSEDEIMLEKQNLETMLNLSTIAFIKSMKNVKNKSKEALLDICKRKNDGMDVQENNVSSISKESVNNKMEVDEKSISKSPPKNDAKLESSKMDTNLKDIDEELPEPVVEMVKTAEKKGWVHMDDLESEKVKWMQDLPNNKENNQPPEEPYNARFDFNGVLLPFNDESLTVDKGLHHHGEEPERPGYSLQELLQLTRSETQQQRCMALITLANIMEKTHQGWYDRALKPPLLNTLNEKNIMLLLRFSLDDTALPVITASLQAFRAFLFSETDEICLDKIFGIEDFEEPILKPSMKDVDDVESLKDHELAQLDTVAALIRSDIVLRIRFLLSEIKLPPLGVTVALEILTRLARHSRETALNIGCTPNLLDCIVKKCIPLSKNKPVVTRDSSKMFGCPVVAAVRLCRILIIYAGRPIVERLKNLGIIHSLLNYISSDSSTQEVRLHIESLRLWRLFLYFGIETDSIVGARLILISQLRLLASTLDIDSASPLMCDYAAALIAITKYDEPLKEHVSILLAKWSTQLSRISTPNWNNTVLITEALKSLGDVPYFHKNWIKNFKVFQQLSSSSNLLSGLDCPIDRDPSSLPSLSVMTFEGNLQPIMSQQSNLIFLKTALEVLLKNNSNNDIEEILNNANLQNYLQRLKSSEWSLERSWFTRIEYSLLVTIVQAESHVNTNVKSSQLSDTVWKIAIKLISALPADCAMNVRDILVFSLAPDRINLRFLENGLKKLELSEKYVNMEGLDNPSLAVKLYEKFVSSKGSWSEAAMPKDWLYLPLVDSYTRIKSEKSWRPSSTLEILNLLKLELIMPELTQNLSPNLRFSRMLLLYLCETVFIHPPECELPQKIIGRLVRENYKKFNFTGEIPGLNSFTDLFTALCENFLANSYGQDCFAQALLVFIAQRFDVHYRKLLWSEHAGTLQYCRLTSENLIVPFHEYLYPLEKDTSLIEAYITALVRNTIHETRSPVLYTIALHHSAMYLKETTKLATLMRSRINKLLNVAKMKNIAEKLLNYQAPAKESV